jgi:RHS repeat-associated protein
VRYIDELIIRDRDATGNGALGERLYALQDPNWNVVALSDVAGTVVERYRYSAYGEPAFLTGAFASRDSSSYDVSTLYCGYRWDRVLESYLVRNRVLWPNVGRWDRRDPIGYRGGINLYGYVGNAPMDAVDPQGTASKAECEAQEAAATTNMAKYLDCMKSKKCAAPQLECRGNDDPTCKKGWRGFQPPSQPGVVVVCYQNIAASIILETFEHELMHVFDACCLGRAANVGPTGKVDCDQWACTEIRASTFNCYPGSPWWKAGGGTYKGCVMASATSSLATSSTCAASAAASVSKMYAQCAIPQGGALPGPVPWPLPLKGTPKALKGKTP